MIAGHINFQLPHLRPAVRASVESQRDGTAAGVLTFKLAGIFSDPPVAGLHFGAKLTSFKLPFSNVHGK